MKYLILLGSFAPVGCGETTGDWATLYRNSPLERNMRVHFATFDAPDKGGFNRENCDMAARVLNANVEASAKANG